MNRRFVDSNVLIGAIGQRDTVHGRRAFVFLLRVLDLQEHVIVEPTTILETACVLTRKLRLPAPVVAESLLRFVDAETVACTHKPHVVEAPERWRDQPDLSFADWFHLVMARESGATEIYTFDRAMDRLPGVARIEP